MNAWTLFGNGILPKAGTKESVIAYIKGESDFFFECCGRLAEEIQNIATQLYFWCCSPDD